MIQANELRIGNKLSFLGDIVTFKNITEIREDGIFWIKTFEPKIESKNFHFQPIPLNEEWLLKFGFELTDSFTSSYSLRLKPFAIEAVERDNGKITVWLNGDVVKIQFVHQLQNLYFCLTGTELTVA